MTSPLRTTASPATAGVVIAYVLGGVEKAAVFSSRRLTQPEVCRTSSEILVPCGADGSVCPARMAARKNFAVTGANEIVHAPTEYSRTKLGRRSPGSSATT